MRRRGWNPAGCQRNCKLQDAIINSLCDYYSYVTPGPKTANAAALNKRLMRETERPPGKGLVKKISINGAVQQRSDCK